jgi:hypothetical protein
MRRRKTKTTRPLSLIVAASVCAVILAAFAGLAIANVTTGGSAGFDALSAGSSPEPTPTPNPTPNPGPSQNTTPSPTPPAPAPAPTPPTLVAVKGSKLVANGKRAKFSFSSTTPGATFVCKVDGKPFKPCASPFRAPKLNAGHHTFVVQSVDPASGLRSTVSKVGFSVQKPPKKQKSSR